MSIFSMFKIKFLSFFRDIFIYHTSSLEFRAKIFAAVISVNNKINECEEKILTELSNKIYKNSARAQLLVQVTHEYIDKIVEKNELDLNALIKNIDNDIKEHKRFAYKINIKDLKRFLECNIDEEIQIIQQRIIEFLQSEIKEYTKSK